MATNPSTVTLGRGSSSASDERVSALSSRLTTAVESLVAAKVIEKGDESSPLAQLRMRAEEMLQEFQDRIIEWDGRKADGGPEPASWGPMSQTRRRNRIIISGPDTTRTYQIDTSRLSKAKVNRVMDFYAALSEMVSEKECDEVNALSSEAREKWQQRQDVQPPGGGETTQETAEPDGRRKQEPESKPKAAATITHKQQSRTTSTRSQLLQEYNEIRDIGQQLIGMIAEHRGVPIKSLYETKEFGVGPDD